MCILVFYFIPFSLHSLSPQLRVEYICYRIVLDYILYSRHDLIIQSDTIKNKRADHSVLTDLLLRQLPIFVQLRVIDVRTQNDTSTPLGLTLYHRAITYARSTCVKEISSAFSLDLEKKTISNSTTLGQYGYCRALDYIFGC